MKVYELIEDLKAMMDEYGDDIDIVIAHGGEELDSYVVVDFLTISGKVMIY